MKAQRTNTRTNPYPPSGSPQPVPVRMTTAGNSRALPVPAAVARRHADDLGRRWILREVGSALVYEPADERRAVPGPVSSGSGSDRLTAVPLEAVGVVDDVRAGSGIHDWSF